MCTGLDLGSARVLRFGPFSLIPAQNILLENDRPVRIGSRAFIILIALVERAGELVSKEVLLGIAWPDSTVDEGNLRVHVAGLRKLLGDGQAGKRYIINVAGRGYQFVAPVSLAEQQATEKHLIELEDMQTLPPRLTRMVGRSDTVVSLRQQLQRRQFITIIGPGGIGKTTVALAVADSLFKSYDNGVRFVDLAPLTDSILVTSAVAATLGIGARSENSIPDIVAFLRNKQMLLVLDSCEHVIDSVANLVEEVIRSAPDVNILATSREPLRVQGEWVHRITPLGVPEKSKVITAAEAMQFPAVQLFVERAAACKDGFELSDDDAPVVAEICRRLDGIALAVELAAGRVDMFGVRGLAGLLDDRFRVLTHGRRTALLRHQTLSAAVDWSFDALHVSEQVFLRRLSVFAGPFTLEAAGAIALNTDTAEPGCISLLASLVSKSLVAADVTGKTVQYRLLDTMRAYAAAKLAIANEVDQYARVHAEYYRSLFENAESERHMRPAADWLETYGCHIDNVRSALDWAFTSKSYAQVGLDLTLSAAPLWTHLSLNAEARSRIHRALAATRSNTSPDYRKEMQLFAELGGVLVVTAGTDQEVNAAWARVLELAELLSDTEYQLRALWGLWIGTLRAAQYLAALALAKSFRRVAVNSSDEADTLIGERLIGFTLFFLGDFGGTRLHTERMLASYVSPANRLHIVRFQFDQHVVAHVTLATTFWLQGLVDRALNLAISTVDEAGLVEHPNSLAYALAQATCPIAIFTGDIATAERFLRNLMEHNNKYAGSAWSARARCIEGLLYLRKGELSLGRRLLESELSQPLKKVFHTSYPYHWAELANAVSKMGETDRGLSTISAAIAQADENNERWCMPELLRIKGEIKLRMGGTQALEDAEQAFQTSLEWARNQGALSWQLRTAISFARLRQIQNRRHEARDILAPIYACFQEGFETHDLRQAKALMDSLI